MIAEAAGHEIQEIEQSYFRRLVLIDRLRLALARAMYGRTYTHGPDNPLVSVTIPTYNRGELLISRTLPPILSQTYPHIEVIVVGDNAPDDTVAIIESVRDPRLRFINLPVRGEYPTHCPRARWQVAGTKPMNRAMALARGHFIAYCDDDALFSEDHVEILLRLAQEHSYEFVTGGSLREHSPGHYGPHSTDVAHQTWFYRTYLRCFRYDMECWRYGLCGDYALKTRMANCGVRMGHTNRTVSYAPLRPGEISWQIETN